jgi:hypothetical protein
MKWGPGLWGQAGTLAGRWPYLAVHTGKRPVPTTRYARTPPGAAEGS